METNHICVTMENQQELINAIRELTEEIRLLRAESKTDNMNLIVSVDNVESEISKVTKILESKK